MEDKKKYIAIVLFLLIGLTIFTFANPSENTSLKEKKIDGNNNTEVINKEDKEKDTNVKYDKDDDLSENDDTEISDENIATVVKINNNDKTNLTNKDTSITDPDGGVIDKDKTESDKNDDTGKDENESGKDEELPEDNGYAEALAAVNLAASSLKLEDVEKAKELVNKVTDKNLKNELLEKINVVEESIETIQLVNQLEKLVHESTSMGELDKARTYHTNNNVATRVSTLRNATLKEELTSRLNSLAKLLNDKNMPVITGVTNNSITNKDVNFTVEDENDVTVKVTLNGVVLSHQESLKEEGVYEITVEDAAFNKQTITFIIDKTAPTLTIINPNDNKLEVGSTYIDEGYYAYDTVDKDVTNLIKITYQFQVKNSLEWICVDNLDTKKLGTYKIIYTAYDKAGNSISGSRVVEIVDTTAPLLTLNGNSKIVLEAGVDSYIEECAKAVDNYDGIIENIQPESITYIDADKNLSKVTTVDNKKLGTYEIVYKYTDSNNNEGIDANNSNNNYVTRIVVVQDTLAPKLKLNGEGNILLESGTDTYIELGALAEDEVDGIVKLSPFQIDYYVDDVLKGAVDSVDMTKPGTYKIVYKYIDKAGNVGIDESNKDYDYVIRIVTVKANKIVTITNVKGTVALDEQNKGFYKSVFYAEIINKGNLEILEKGFLITDLGEIVNSADFIYENASTEVNEKHIIKMPVSGNASSYRLNIRKVKPNQIRYGRPYIIVRDSNGVETIIYGEAVKTVTPNN